MAAPSQVALGCGRCRPDIGIVGVVGKPKQVSEQLVMVRCAAR